MVIVLVSLKDPKLHIPMYFFLSNLSLVDLCFTSSCVPQMLINFCGPEKTISYIGCAIQLYVFLWLGATECVLLVVMSVDRYVAVCHPLQYTMIMHPKLCLQLAILAWGTGLAQSLIQSPATLQLPFCSHRMVDDVVCEVPALIQLSSTDTTYNEIQMSTASVILLVVPLIIILSSYDAIAKAVLRIKSTVGQKKAFGTCTSHLLVVSLFYGTVTASPLLTCNVPFTIQCKAFAMPKSTVTALWCCYQADAPAFQNFRENWRNQKGISIRFQYYLNTPSCFYIHVFYFLSGSY
ncbi:hypothetical protein H8959_010930 [Pygathrix nigripes]